MPRCFNLVKRRRAARAARASGGATRRVASPRTPSTSVPPNVATIPSEQDKTCQRTTRGEGSEGERPGATRRVASSRTPSAGSRVRVARIEGQAFASTARSKCKECGGGGRLRAPAHPEQVHGLRRDEHLRAPEAMKGSYVLMHIFTLHVRGYACSVHAWIYAWISQRIQELLSEGLRGIEG